MNDPVSFTFVRDTVDFQHSAEKRRVSGTLLPYNVVGQNASGRWKFAVDSVTWKESAVSRVKLNREHSREQLLGVAAELSANSDGIHAVFKIARGVERDDALSLAEDGVLDGFSPELIVLEHSPDPSDPSVHLVTSAKLIGAALTASPGFDDARLTAVAASTHAGRITAMPKDNAGDAAHIEAFTTAVDQFTAAVQALTNTIPSEQRQTINPSYGDGVKREPLVYSLNGLGESFVRDAWNVRHAVYGSQVAEEAMSRLRKYGEQTADLSAQAVQRFANAGNTTDQADIIPPGYRPDLYVGQIPQGRPLYDSVGTRVLLANATPFKVPTWEGSANLSGTNSEGTGPSTGTITDHNYETVTPTAQSGEFVVTRELMDSANPAIDVIALNAMREEYSQDTEGLIATALAAATDNDTGSGQSTEGCYVYTVTGTGNDLYTEGIRLVEGEYPAHRFLTPDRMLAGPTGYSALVRAVDDVGRPVFPFLSPSNAGGTVGRAAGTLNVDGLAVPNAWSMTSTHDDIAIFNAVDVLAGESPLLTFRFEEKGGPENIYLNIWGYFCFQILRYTGIHTINYTAV